MRADIVPGAIFPDYSLTDHTGKRRTLSELQGPDPLILVLSRGGFCPKDRRQAEGLALLHREMEVGHCRLVTISTDNVVETNEYRTGVDAHWTFLSDAGRMVQKDLAGCLQDLYGELVFRAADAGGAAAGFAGSAKEVPAGLGHYGGGIKGGVGPRREGSFLSLRQELH